MKSRTWFFNGTVLKKDITRFAPVWGLYTIILLLQLTNFSGEMAYRVRNLALYQISALTPYNLIYAFVCGLMLFGDLFKSSSCNALHAMPLRREGWFLTHTAAALLFSFVPNLLYTLLCILYMPGFYYVPLTWLAVNTLQFLFFFGLVSFSAMCAGSRLGLTAVYFTCNFLFAFLGEYIDLMYIPLLHGVELDKTFFDILTPTIVLSEDYLNMTFTGDRIFYNGIFAENWLCAGIAAAVGIGLGVAAVLLYRKRNLESAGDFIALPAAKPVFLLILTLMAELLVFVICYIPLLGMVVGYFCCRMLQERTVRVFRWKFIWRLLVLLALYIVSMLVTWLDPLGITRYVPEADQIQSVQYAENSYILYSNGEETLDGYLITDPAQIEQFRQFHSELTEYREFQTDSVVTTVTIRYRLENGKTVSRKYQVDVGSPLGQEAAKYFSRWEYLFGTTDWERVVENLNLIIYQPARKQTDSEEPESIGIGGDRMKQLMEALRADCESGAMAQSWSFSKDKITAGELQFYRGSYSEKEMVLTVTSECTNVLEYLATLETE